MINLSKQHADWDSSRKIRLGEKWLLIFWRGAIVVDEEPETNRPYTEEDQAHFTCLWNVWCVIPRVPLARDRERATASGGLLVSLQEFVTESGKKFYLMKDVLDYLPEDRQLSFWYPQGSHLILVTDEKQQPIAVFARIVPNNLEE